MGEKAQELDIETFEQIALPHWDTLYRNALRLCRDKAKAEDLTQETFLVGWRKFHQVRDVTKVKPWLNVILRNLFLGSVMKNKERLLVDVDGFRENLVDKQTGTDMYDHGYSDGVQHQLERLDEKFKEPMLMAVVDGMSYKDISDKLGIPMGTVMSRISRGKTFMRDNISRTGIDMENLTTV